MLSALPEEKRALLPPFLFSSAGREGRGVAPCGEEGCGGRLSASAPPIPRQAGWLAAVAGRGRSVAFSFVFASRF